jgi:hypothetical protein
MGNPHLGTLSRIVFIIEFGFGYLLEIVCEKPHFLSDKLPITYPIACLAIPMSMKEINFATDCITNFCNSLFLTLKSVK